MSSLLDHGTCILWERRYATDDAAEWKAACRSLSSLSSSLFNPAPRVYLRKAAIEGLGLGCDRQPKGFREKEKELGDMTSLSVCLSPAVAAAPARIINFYFHYRWTDYMLCGVPAGSFGLPYSV